MVNCCKCGVVYNVQAKDKGITFHKFPTAKKKDLRVKWLAFANLTETTLKNQRLCSQHFHPSDFYHFDANSQRLLDNAVPKEPTHMDQLSEIETEEYEGNPTISGEYSSVTAITTSIVTSCSVLGCSNRAGRNNGISFFRFPNDKTILKKWLAAMRRRNWKPTPNSRLCSAHFTPDSYVTSGWSSLQRLAEDAVPSIFFFNVPVDAQIPPGVIELSIPAQSKVIVRKNNRIHEFEEINDFDGDEGIEEEAVCMSEEENMEDMNLVEEVEETNEIEQQMANNETAADVKKEIREDNTSMSEEENTEDMNLVEEIEETNEIEQEMENNETEADVEKEENEISRKRKRETKVKHEEKRTKKSEKVSSKLVDLFQQPFVIDHLLKYVEQKIPEAAMDSSTHSENENETIASSKCVCRLCTNSDKTIYVKLFHADKTMTPIANKIAYLMGEHKIEQDLLPQQICLGCSEMVDSSYEALRQFSKSYQILSDVVTELRNRTQLFFFKNGPKKVALYLKISDKDYEFSSNLQTTTGLEGSTKRSTIAKCFVCLENFDSGDSLKAHTSEVHSCKIEYKCASCNITFPTFTDLRAHMKISTVCNLKHKDTQLEHETRNKQNVDLPLSENVNTNNFVDETDSNDHYVNEVDNTDDCTKSENSDRISEINIDEDIIVPNEDDADPIACTLLKRKRKKQIVLQYYIKILKKGPVESRSCNYCDQIFKLTHSDEYIKAHILTHSLSHDKESMDINTLDIGQHAGTTSCYVCSLCKIVKTTPAALKQHLSLNCSVLRKKYNLTARRGGNADFLKLQSKIYYCKTCNDNAPYKKKEFKLHMKENHPELLQEKLRNVSECQNILHKCKTCNNDTPYEVNELKLHMKEDHPELVLNCPYCENYFIERFKLSAHIEAAHLKHTTASTKDEEKGPILCEYCSLECKSKQGYLNHMKTHLNPNAKPKKQRKIRQRFQLRERDQKRPRHGFEWLHCHVCNKMLQFKEGPAALEFHIQRHNYPDNKVECCNRKYDIYIKYKKHLRSHSKNWPCKICDVPCSSMVQLQDHLTQCHTKRCEECGHKAKNFAEYNSHKETHNKSSEVELLCLICNLHFDSKHRLKVHRNQFHWDECKPKERTDLQEPITCCGKKFLKRDNLKKHTAKHIETPCKRCGDVLMSKLALVSHNAAHHTQGRECQYCNKIYTNSDTLKYHMLKHTRGRRFKCLCGLAYYTESDLRKHQKTRKIPCIGGKMLQDRQSDVETVEVMPWNMEL